MHVPLCRVPARLDWSPSCVRSVGRSARAWSPLVLSALAGFVAGLILSHITGSLQRLPGLLVLIPAAVGMRGTIFGALEARLGTSIHAGLFHLRFAGQVPCVTTCRWRS